MNKLDKIEIGKIISIPEVFLKVYNKLDEIVDWINDVDVYLAKIQKETTEGENK